MQYPQPLNDLTRKPWELDDNEIHTLVIMMEDLRGIRRPDGTYDLPDYYENIKQKLKIQFQRAKSNPSESLIGL
jgi:hypothetical protein|tara:strand:+ start:689 stop:910 length:222 start_codon:yes stop_codon:yes gene_type:complete